MNIEPIFVRATQVFCKTCGGYRKSKIPISDSTFWGHREDCPVLWLEAHDGKIYVYDYEIVFDHVTEDYLAKEIYAMLFERARA